MSVFETATRKKYRFPSSKGELTTEQLWDLPLSHSSNFDLDTVAKTVNGLLKDASEESFVKVTPNVKRTELENKLEVVKTVIAVKVEEARRATDAKARAEKRAKLLEAISAKDDEEISKKSKDELLKELAAIDGDA